MDLLYKDSSGWHILDFKTDEVHDEEGLEKVVDKYRGQLNRYLRAAAILLGAPVDARLVLLDMEGAVFVQGIDV